MKRVEIAWHVHPALSVIFVARMVDPQQVIDESRPMLQKFLQDLGLYEIPQPIADPNLLSAFSDWLLAQKVADAHFNYVVSRVAAFICEYLIEAQAANRLIVEGRILLRLPTVDGRLREFDPYAVAVGIVGERRNLKELIQLLSH